MQRNHWLIALMAILATLNLILANDVTFLDDVTARIMLTEKDMEKFREIPDAHFCVEFVEHESDMVIFKLETIPDVSKSSASFKVSLLNYLPAAYSSILNGNYASAEQGNFGFRYGIKLYLVFQELGYLMQIKGPYTMGRPKPVQDLNPNSTEYELTSIEKYLHYRKFHVFSDWNEFKNKYMDKFKLPTKLSVARNRSPVMLKASNGELPERIFVSNGHEYREPIYEYKTDSRPEFPALRNEDSAEEYKQARKKRKRKVQFLTNDDVNNNP